MTNPASLAQTAPATRKDGEIEPVTPVDEFRAFLAQFIYATPAELDAIVIWVCLTWVYESFSTSPRLAMMGPKGTGKSTVLKILKIFCARAIKASNASDAAVFAAIAAKKPTLLFDEVDAIFGASPTGGYGNKRETLRGILDDGADEDGNVLRSRNGECTEFPVFCPVAFGGIGELPETLDDRAWKVHMAKPYPAEAARLTDWEIDLYGDEARAIARSLKAFVTERIGEFEIQPADMPDDVILRAARIFKPGISLADSISPEWGARMRAACRELVLGVSSKPVMAPGEELCRVVAEYATSDATMTTVELIGMLAKAQGKDGRLLWATWLDSPAAAAKALSSLLRPYGIEPVQFTRKGQNRRGYRMGDFAMWSDLLVEEAS